MAVNVMKYSGVHSKTCAMKKELLKYTDFKRLSTAESVKSFTDMLGEYEPYKAAVKNAAEHGANRIALERSLDSSLFRDFYALYTFITDQNERRYLDAVSLRYAVDIVKALIRRIFDHRNLHSVMVTYQEFISERLGLNAHKIEQSQTLAELLENTKGTEIHDVLSKINKENPTLFDYEIQLDFYCFLKANACAKKRLSGKERASALRLNGAEVDLHNIMWVLRAKTYYDIADDKIFTYLIPLNYMLSNAEVRALVQSEGREKFLEALAKTHYRNVFEATDAEGIENGYTRYMARLYKNEARSSPYSLAGVSSHLYFKRQEINSLTTLIECVRYGLSSESAMGKLSLDYLGV